MLGDERLLLLLLLLLLEWGDQSKKGKVLILFLVVPMKSPYKAMSTKAGGE